MAGRILVLQPGIKPLALLLEVQSLNWLWTLKKDFSTSFLEFIKDSKIYYCYLKQSMLPIFSLT